MRARFIALLCAVGIVAAPLCAHARLLSNADDFYQVPSVDAVAFVHDYLPFAPSRFAAISQTNALLPGFETGYKTEGSEGFCSVGTCDLIASGGGVSLCKLWEEDGAAFAPEMKRFTAGLNAYFAKHKGFRAANGTLARYGAPYVVWSRSDGVSVTLTGYSSTFLQICIDR